MYHHSSIYDENLQQNIDHGFYINCWFRKEDFLLFIWLSANFLFLDGKTVVSRYKRLRKALTRH